MRFVVALGSFALVTCGAARADVSFKITTTSTAQPAKVETQQVRITDDKLAFESNGEAGNVSMIFRGKDKALYVVQHDEKNYMQLDEAFGEEVGSQMQSAMKQMESELSKLPPEQRAQVEAMMGQALKKPAAAAASPALEFKATGATQKVDGVTCKQWEVWSGKEKEREMWVASWSDLKLDRKDLGVLEDMAQFFAETWKSVPALQDMNPSEYLAGELERIQGFPLLGREFEDGKVTQETRIGDFRRERVPAAAFEIPAGYARRTMGSLD